MSKLIEAIRKEKKNLTEISELANIHEINQKDINGLTPLMHAIMLSEHSEDKIPITRILIKSKGIDLNIRTPDNKDIITFADEIASPAVVRMLREHISSMPNQSALIAEEKSNFASNIIIKADGGCLFRAMLTALNDALATDADVLQIRSQVASVLANDKYSSLIKGQIIDDIKKVIAKNSELNGYKGEFLRKINKVIFQVKELVGDERDLRLEQLITEEFTEKYIEGIKNGSIWGGYLEISIM